MQALVDAKSYSMKQQEKDTIDYIERCAVGVIECPKRPLIISDWWYQVMADSSVSGESIWFSELVRAKA